MPVLHLMLCQFMFVPEFSITWSARMRFVSFFFVSKFLVTISTFQLNSTFISVHFNFFFFRRQKLVNLASIKDRENDSKQVGTWSMRIPEACDFKLFCRGISRPSWCLDKDENTSIGSSWGLLTVLRSLFQSFFKILILIYFELFLLTLIMIHLKLFHWNVLPFYF